MVASHRNGDIDDNRPGNLLWETQRDNLARREQHGTMDRGVNNTRACVSEEDVRRIRELRTGHGKTHQAIATLMGISRTSVSRILNGLRYEEVR